MGVIDGHEGEHQELGHRAESEQDGDGVAVERPRRFRVLLDGPKDQGGDEKGHGHVGLDLAEQDHGQERQEKHGREAREHPEEDRGAEGLDEDHGRGQDGDVPGAGDPVGQVIGIDLERRVVEVAEDASVALDLVIDRAGGVGVLSGLEGLEDGRVGPDDL